VDELARLQVREDSLGLDSILYFPSMKWPEDVTDDDADE
jgi:hypothetical protein